MPANPRLTQALTAHRAGQLPEAERHYRRALQSDPGNAAALHGLGVALHQLGQHDRALGFLDRALRAAPDDAIAATNRAAVLAALGRHSQARDALTTLAAAHPADAGIRFNRGNAHLALGAPTAALADFEAAIALRPGLHQARQNRGVALNRLERFDEALAAFTQLIALDPCLPDAHREHGDALLGLHQPAEALASYARAEALKPGVAEVALNRGFALDELGRREEARTAYEIALAIDPRLPGAHWNLALHLLAAGDPRGWEEYEWRWLAPGGTTPRRHYPQPLWQGEAEIAGRTILLHPEQGMGDTLQFCRYAALVAALGAHVVLEVQPPLLRVMRTLAGPAEVISTGDARPIDLHFPLLSLPLAFKGQIPSAPYLSANPDLAARWAEKLPPGRRIGIAWRGNPVHRNDRNRSMKLAALLPLADCGAALISIQTNPPESDRPAMAALGLHELDLEDFADTAAVMAQLDLVIGVDSAPVHLAGALGRPVWVMLGEIADWRWMRGRADSPWYPTARLFRQKAQGDWASVAGAVRAAL